MDYQMTRNELTQALNRIRVRFERTADEVDRALLIILLRRSGDATKTRNYLFDLTPEQAARLDWALER